MYLVGLRLEQFHNGIVDPLPYYEEALRRDPSDLRVNTVLGIRLAKQAKFAEAEKILGELYFKNNLIEEAEQIYKKIADMKAADLNEDYSAFIAERIKYWTQNVVSEADCLTWVNENIKSPSAK